MHCSDSVAARLMVSPTAARATIRVRSRDFDPMTRIFPLAAVYLLALAIAPVAHAEPWQRLGPDGGEVTALVAAPGGNGRVLALTAGGLFKSDDAGRHWQETGSGLSFDVTYGGPISRSATWLPSHYLFEAGVRLMRSEDNGDSWTPTGLHLVGGDNANAILAIPGGVIYSSYAGTFRSTDFGATFTPVQGLPAGTRIASLSMNPDSLHLLAGVAFRGPDEPAVYRSTDMGMTWTPLLSPADAGVVTDIVMVDALTTVVSLNGLLFVSIDQGASWTQSFALAHSRLVQTSVRGAELIAMNGRECFRSSNYFLTAAEPCAGGLPSAADIDLKLDVAVVSDSGSYRVLATARSDGVIALQSSASAWTPSLAQLQAEPRRGLALSSTDRNRLWSGRVRSDQLAPAVIRSADGGQSWQGSLTERANFIRTLALDPTTASAAHASTLYAAGDTVHNQVTPPGSGIFKSLDSGVTWTSLDEGIPASGSLQGGVRLSTVRKLLLDPRSCASPPAQGACTAGPLNTVYALSSGSGSDRRFRVIKSTQGGANWTPIGTHLPDDVVAGTFFQAIFPVDLEIDSDGALYLSVFGEYYDDEGGTPTATITSGVFRSNDGGQTWTPRNAGLPYRSDSVTTTRDVFALVIHPRQPGVVWASTIEAGQSAQIHLSVDGGENWKGIGTELTDCDVRDLQIDSAAPQVLYAAGIALNGSKGCVWRSEDGGFNWTSLSAGLPVHAVYDVRQQPQDHRRLVLTTSSGLWHGLVPSDRIFNDIEY